MNLVTLNSPDLNESKYDAEESSEGGGGEERFNQFLSPAPKLSNIVHRLPQCSNNRMPLLVRAGL